jgi:hypothetical protein
LDSRATSPPKSAVFCCQSDPSCRRVCLMNSSTADCCSHPEPTSRIQPSAVERQGPETPAIAEICLGEEDKKTEPHQKAYRTLQYCVPFPRNLWSRRWRDEIESPGNTRDSETNLCRSCINMEPPNLILCAKKRMHETAHRCTDAQTHKHISSSPPSLPLPHSPRPTSSKCGNARVLFHPKGENGKRNEKCVHTSRSKPERTVASPC